MRLLGLLGAASLCWTASASAQFKTENNVKLTWGTGNFECGVVQLAPRETDNDPIYKIVIFVSFKDRDRSPSDTASDAALDNMSVLHVSVTGKTYLRSDQYISDHLTQVPGKLEINWRGRRIKKSSVVMIGKLWNDSVDSKWYYAETQTQDGVPSMKMLAICHTVDSD